MNKLEKLVLFLDTRGNFTNFKIHLWSTWGAQCTRTLSWTFSGLVIFLSHVFYSIHSLHGSGSVWNFKWCYTDILENSEIVLYRQRRRFWSQFQYDSKLTPRNSKVQKPAPQSADTNFETLYSVISRIVIRGHLKCLKIKLHYNLLLIWS